MIKDISTPLMDRRQMLLTTAGVATCVLVSPQSGAAQSDIGPGRSQPFDLGWRFQRGAGEGFESPDFDDSAWRALDLPHDWGIEDLLPTAEPNKATVVGPFDRNAEGGTATGFSVGGEGWYRKRFRLQAPLNGRVEILFEGIYMDSDAWINGRHLGTHPNGYTPIAYELTPHLSTGRDNVVAVRLRNLGKNSRWYSGSGIYRHVWLDVLPEQARVARWGVGIATRRVLRTGADIEISTRLEAFSNELTLVTRVKDEDGRLVRENSAPAEAEVRQTVSILSPRLWSPERPVLYTLETELRRGKFVVDRVSSEFGIRIVAFDAERGMTINGVPSKLRGGCIHHDNGLLGAAAFDAAEERKVQLLKARGFNAVRPSHNPFSAAFLRACDRHGMLVMAETFDAWTEPKLPQDYSVYFEEQWRSDLATMVLSARNHPSIILWSIGNEIPGRNSPAGVETQWHLANEVHRLDPTRPVTAAINSFAGRPVTPSGRTARSGAAGIADRTSVVFLDVVGYNYKLSEYETDHQLFPKRIFFGSESFPKDVVAIWDLTARNPWLLGDFVWTAMDYLGEAGIGGSAVLAVSSADNPLALMSTWPWVNSYCGDVDLIGQQKAQSLARDVVWGLSPLEIAVQRPLPDGKLDVARLWGWHDELRSWTWPGVEGKTLTVRVYTAADRVELRLNGRTLQSKPVTAADMQCIEFTTPYEPGTLEALAFRKGIQIARRQLVTAGAATAIRLTPERTGGAGARGGISYLGLEIIDVQGHLVPDATHHIQLSLEGPAELLAFGSANPFAIGSLHAPTAQSWNGRALAILRGIGRPGRVTLRASADGLRAESIAFPMSI